MLLMGGATISIGTSWPAGAQVAQNAQIGQTVRTVAPASFAKLAEQLAPAVVNISTRQRVQVSGFNPFAGTPFENLFGGPDGQPLTREAQSLGSGFIIAADGYVVTNSHVISPPGHQGEVESISVTMSDGTEYSAEVVGHDAASDLAVLKIAADKPLPFVEFGDSRNSQVGDWVIAIGNPFGLGGTVTSGIISAVYRNTGSGSAYDRYIQTDASINRGNSGGPMFDMEGQVIGINNAIFSPTGGSVGIGFAIPAEVAAPIVEKLKAGEPIERGYLGVRIQAVTEDLADSLGIQHDRGAFVHSVEPGRAAAEAGVRAGDVIVEVEGREVTSRENLPYLIANRDPGDRVPIELIRNGRRMRVSVALGERPTEEELARQSFGEAPGGDEFGGLPEIKGEGTVEKSLGLSVQPLTSQIARQLGVSAKTSGLVINAVDTTSDAARKGLSRGDIVLSANNRSVKTIAELEARIREAKDDEREALLLRVQRRGQAPNYIPVRLR